MKQVFGNKAGFFGIVAVASALCTIALDLTLPYRIHQGIYTWYRMAQPLMTITALVCILATVLVFVFGIRSRQTVPIALAAVSVILVVYSTAHQFAHSGADPQAWCYNHLRQIESAKSQIASENTLTNGAALTEAQISKYIGGGLEGLVCAEHGKYTVGAVGTEARCSVHGSMSEMEREWQKAMQPVGNSP